MLRAGQRQLEAVSHGDRGSHVHRGVHGRERRQGAQGIAADVAGHDGPHPRELLEHEAMGASRTQRRRASRQIGRSRRMGRLLKAEGRAHEPRRQLAGPRQGARRLAHRHPAGPHGVFEVLRALLHDVHGFDGIGEIAQGGRGKWPGDPELEDARVRERLGHVLVGRAGADDAHSALPFYHLVVGAGFHPLAQLIDAIQLHEAARLGESGHHDPLRRILLIGPCRRLGTLPRLDGRLRMGDAHAGADDHRHVEALGDIVGLAGEAQGLGGIGRIEARDGGGLSVVVRVLLVLGGVHARVVGGQDDHTAAHTGVGGREQRVGRHVHAHMLHGGEHPRAGGRGPDAHFHGHLLVHAPLGVDALLLGEGLQRLR